jgi:hypothetical protein
LSDKFSAQPTVTCPLCCGSAAEVLCTQPGLRAFKLSPAAPACCRSALPSYEHLMAAPPPVLRRATILRGSFKLANDSAHLWSSNTASIGCKSANRRPERMICCGKCLRLADAPALQKAEHRPNICGRPSRSTSTVYPYYLCLPSNRPTRDNRSALRHKYVYNRQGRCGCEVDSALVSPASLAVARAIIVQHTP